MLRLMSSSLKPITPSDSLENERVRLSLEINGIHVPHGAEHLGAGLHQRLFSRAEAFQQRAVDVKKNGFYAGPPSVMVFS